MENFSDDTADAYFLGFKYLMQFKPQINNWIHVVIFTVFFSTKFSTIRTGNAPNYLYHLECKKENIYEIKSITDFK